ncbi:TPA: hypothetical protein J1306_000273 [Escherichia coli]|nr:hypothetical protein [Escherichia coli]EFH6065002.1 hypothetical protein [Escherichia coli]EID0746860.1 hypothetical protein [Escherichia coli]EIN4033838.1 hypothetical protein [Escherichia coli]MDF6127036.1 hypothetical protein [Escherichia coli]
MYKIEITEDVPGNNYSVLVTDDKSGDVVINCNIHALSTDDAEQFVIQSFKNAFKDN